MSAGVTFKVSTTKGKYNASRSDIFLGLFLVAVEHGGWLDLKLGPMAARAREETDQTVPQVSACRPGIESGR